MGEVRIRSTVGVIVAALTAAALVLLAPSGVVAQTDTSITIRVSLDGRIEAPAAPFLLGLERGYYRSEGLDVRFEPAPDDKQDVTVDMTLTAQGCPAHVQISDQVRSRLEQLPGIRSAHVNVVWSPAWTPERLSPDARKQLGIE